MTEEPVFIHDERLVSSPIPEWIENVCNEGRKHGAVFFRFTAHETETHRYLVEGWLEPQLDQGESRWILSEDELLARSVCGQ